MKEVRKELFNKNKKVEKVTGTVVGKSSNSRLVIKTNTGTSLVDAPSGSYKLTDNVVAYDGVVQGYAGKRSTLTITIV